METFDSICDKAGTHFKFEKDKERGLNIEYMVLPKEGDDYWITPIMNIQAGDPFVGTISRFKSDDAIMNDAIITS